MSDWLSAISADTRVWWWLATLSMVTFLGSLLFVPVIVGRIPNDYFARSHRPTSRWGSHHPALRIAAVVLKNLAGTILVVMGLAMLLLPGQGLLTVLLGVLLLDFPGKFRLERWLVTRRGVLRTINWIRRRANREPLVVGE
jgi:hypothetical protein